MTSKRSGEVLLGFRAFLPLLWPASLEGSGFFSDFKTRSSPRTFRRGSHVAPASPTPLIPYSLLIGTTRRCFPYHGLLSAKVL